MVEPHLVPSGGVRVKVLHGARTVGKTTVAQHMRDAGYYDEYVSLADQRTLRTAKADLPGWLRSLAPRVIIDEAQLLPDLPLELKALVDEVGSVRSYLLTGSASIARTGLGGSDPLAGRAETWTLFPFTQAEIDRVQDAADVTIDQLLGEPPTLERHAADDADMHERMLRGGMPNLVLSQLAQSARDRWVRDMSASILTDDVLPDERFDSGTAQRVLDACLLRTGNVINVTKMASELGIDVRTVDRYLDVLERRFLVWFLPNLALSGARQTRTRAKVYPVDSAFAVEAFRRHDPALLTDPTTMGHVWESYVVNALRAMASTSEAAPELFFWRSPRGDREVDLVLRADSRSVGIEIKMSTSVDLNDGRGLVAMLESGSVGSGYVIHTGTRLTRLADKVWGVPFDALCVPWREPVNPPTRAGSRPDPQGGVVVPDARIFVSYVHADNEYLNNAMTDFASALAQTYEFLFARNVRIEYDEKLLRWGQRWETGLDDAISDTGFLLAFITPRYLVSESCRDEITKFDASHHDDGLLLPLIWVPIDGKQIVQDDDPVMRLIARHQYEDGTALGDLDPMSAGYRTELQRLAQRLHETITSRERISTPVPVDVVDDDDAPGLIDHLAEIRGRQGELDEAVREFGDTFQAMADLVGTINADNLQGKHMNAELARFRSQAEGVVTALDASSSALAAKWDQTLTLLRRISEEYPQFDPTADVPAQLRDVLLPISMMSVPSQDEVVAQLRVLGQLSRFLRPTTRAIEKALRTVDGVRDSCANWLNELGAMPLSRQPDGRQAHLDTMWQVKS
ncbi:MAG: DUF4143 domain-containing protein [Propionibacteriaceae bacterium]|nr:DUF4143 domain-containing protein [Propionibacteriaceae bacterium]